MVATETVLSLDLSDTLEIDTVVRDASGCFYFSDELNHRILKFDAKGTRLWEKGQKGNGPDDFHYPMGMLIVGEHLLVADSWNHRIKVMDFEGETKAVFGQAGSGAEHLSVPTSLIKGPDGDLWVLEEDNQRISVYDLEKVARAPHVPDAKKSCFGPPDSIFPKRFTTVGDKLAIVDAHGVFFADRDTVSFRRTLANPSFARIFGIDGKGVLIADLADLSLAFLDCFERKITPVCVLPRGTRAILSEADQVLAIGEKGLIELPLPSLGSAFPSKASSLLVAGLDHTENMNHVTSLSHADFLELIVTRMIQGATHEDVRQMLTSRSDEDIHSGVQACLKQQIHGCFDHLRVLNECDTGFRIGYLTGQEDRAIDHHGTKSWPSTRLFSIRGSTFFENARAGLNGFQLRYQAVRKLLPLLEHLFGSDFALRMGRSILDILVDGLLEVARRRLKLLAELTELRRGAQDQLAWSRAASLDIEIFLWYRLQQELGLAGQNMIANNAQLSNSKQSQLFAAFHAQNDMAQFDALISYLLVERGEAMPAELFDVRNHRNARAALEIASPYLERCILGKQMIAAPPTKVGQTVKRKFYYEFLVDKHLGLYLCLYRTGENRIRRGFGKTKFLPFFGVSYCFGNHSALQRMISQIQETPYDSMPQAQEYLGHYHFLMGNLADAEKSYSQDESPFALMGRTLLYAERKEAEKLQDCLERIPQHERSLRAASAWLYLGDYEQSLKQGMEVWQNRNHEHLLDSPYNRAVIIERIVLAMLCLDRTDDAKAWMKENRSDFASDNEFDFWNAICERFQKGGDGGLTLLSKIDTHQIVSFHKGLTLRCRGHYQESLFAFEREDTVWPHWQNQLHAALTYGHMEEEENQEKLLASLPQYCWLHSANQKVRKKDPAFTSTFSDVIRVERLFQQRQELSDADREILLRNHLPMFHTLVLDEGRYCQ
ncbi:hypothetical protein SCOR_18870 [Sulfidibacter corallicola]|uniref:NHL repeat-containing protein n=1 Tax=Sulfidibacter corallicola TaxID=2818388 RepID=A0A8A4TWD5_SULCO|nr:NHL repeat-containing protein [Sulfidibacter corallicola]QTD53491.1 hypothetical protein J3U87_13635 [Sulfidibacter corallicola]